MPGGVTNFKILRISWDIRQVESILSIYTLKEEKERGRKGGSMGKEG